MAEIERKFKLRAPPEPLPASGTPIRQGYLVTGEIEMRIRAAADAYYLTVKGAGGVSRDEWEEAIPAWVFEALWPRAESCAIVKTRYITTVESHDLEIDVYEGPLHGLVVLEVEFDDEEGANAFRLPAWASDAVDVTNDAAYKNQNLARHGLPD